MNDGLLKTVVAARRTATPIFSVETQDQYNTQKLLERQFVQEKLNGQPCQPNLIRWDTIGGFVGLNDPGKAALAEFCQVDATKVYKLEDALTLLAGAPPNTVTMVHNAQCYISEPPVAQGVQNLREPYKRKRSAVVLLGPRIALPPQLQQDVIGMEELLPDDVRLREIVCQQYKSARVPNEPIEGDLQRAVEALRGLSEYAAEQVCAMAMTPTGIHLGNLWNFKRKQIEQTPGLKMYPERETFADIGGLVWIKQQLTRIANGKRRPAAFVYLDELEKMMAGSSTAHGDNTGVAQDQLKTLLTRMDEEEWSGMILLGNPGAGKSLLSRACGGEFKVPTLEMDLGDMKTSELGGSESNIRAAMKAVKGIAGNRAFFVASCNAIENIPPALERRFGFGIFYAPMPDGGDLEQIWKINMARFSVDPNQELPGRITYTGAEIRRMCDLADQMGISLVEASKIIAPIAVSNPQSIDALSRFCHKKFRNASTGEMHEHVDIAQLIQQGVEDAGEGRAYQFDTPA
jgi:hypothetical protein